MLDIWKWLDYIYNSISTKIIQFFEGAYICVRCIDWWTTDAWSDRTFYGISDTISAQYTRRNVHSYRFIARQRSPAIVWFITLGNGIVGDDFIRRFTTLALFFFIYVYILVHSSFFYGLLKSFDTIHTMFINWEKQIVIFQQKFNVVIYIFFVLFWVYNIYMQHIVYV